MLVLQAGARAAELVTKAVALSGRPVSGLLGPWEQVEAGAAALGLERARFALYERELLMACDLAPTPGGHGVRAPWPLELDALVPWRTAYDVEALRLTPPADHATRARAELEGARAAGDLFVLERGGALVAMGLFNATLPGLVQLGGIYTPPGLRSAGHARALVAGMLQLAQGRGARRAVLFTKNPAAVRAYRAVGFTDAGSYGLALLGAPGGGAVPS
jgi:GNAT superfamily N-acetyltransferase